MANELKAVVSGMGGEQIFERPLATDRDMRDAIREGFPPPVVEKLMQTSGLTLREHEGVEAGDRGDYELQRCSGSYRAADRRFRSK